MSSLDWLDETILGSEIIVQDLIIAGAIFVLGLILASFMPRIMANNVARIISNFEYRSLRKSRKSGEKDLKFKKGKIDRRLKKTVARPVKRGLIGFYLLLFLVLAIYTLPLQMDTTFSVFKRDYQAWRFLQFGVAFGLIILLSIFALEPILKATIYAMLGSKVSNRHKYR